MQILAAVPAGDERNLLEKQRVADPQAGGVLQGAPLKQMVGTNGVY